MSLKKIYYLVGSFLSIFLLSLVILPKGLNAQEATGLSISPPTFEISANPGEIISNYIRLQNLNDVPMRISVDTRNFTAMGEEGQVRLTEEETPFNLASWIIVSPSEVEIPAKGNLSFNFQIDIPLNAEPGGHFGSIVFRVGGINGLRQKSGAMVAQELGALVLLRIAGPTEQKASLASFKTSQKLFERSPVYFEFRVKNEGNLHIKPTGSVIISNVFGKEVGQTEVESRNVLPGAIRKMEANWQRKFLLGRYRAITSLTYGSEGKFLVASTTFWVFPYKIGGVVLLVLIIIGFFLFKAGRRTKLALRVLFGKYH